MPALKTEDMHMFKRVLDERFVKSKTLPNIDAKGKKPDDLHKKQLSRAFSAFVLEKLCDISIKKSSQAVVDDFNDQGIDAIYYDESSETLYLLQTKLKESEQFQESEADAFCRGVRLLIKQDFDKFNALVKARASEIESALDRCSCIQLVIAYTGDAISKSAEAVLNYFIQNESLDEERLAQEIIYYDSSRVKTDLLAEQAFEKVNTDIFLQKCEKIDEPRKTYYGMIAINDLIVLHKKHGKGLYERNIRYFLGGKSSVNNSIKETLAENPEHFFYLNNGVTAICDIIEPKANKGSKKKLKVRNLSIINGAQTVASSAEFFEDNPDCNIESAKVMFTLIIANESQSFGSQITKARNHQNPVQISNFASLDENQERLRQEISCWGYGYYYRPEANVSFGGRSFGLQDALTSKQITQNSTIQILIFIKNFSR